MNKLQEMLSNSLQVLGMDKQGCIAILLMLKTEEKQIQIIEWLAHNMKATPDQMIEQAIKIYEEN